jgi:hypothetical protein
LPFSEGSQGGTSGDSSLARSNGGLFITNAGEILQEINAFVSSITNRP